MPVIFISINLYGYSSSGETSIVQKNGGDTIG